MRSRFLFTLLFILIAAVSACNPRYSPPCVDPCDGWKNDATLIHAADPLPIFWWEVFNDEQLRCLESRALEASPTLEAAVARLNQAAAQAYTQYAALFPNIILNPSLYHAGTRIPTFFSFDSAAPTFGIPSPTRVQETLYSFPFSASYDVDLWGQNWLTYQSASAQAEASFHQVRQAWLMLTSQVAMAYYQIRSLDLQLNVLEETLKSREKAYELQNDRYNKGLTAYISVAQSGVEVNDVKYQLDEIIRLRAVAENYLGQLIGMPACCFHLARRPLDGPPPPIPLAVPCQVLAQRPDIAAAERQLYAANRQIGVAETAFLPALTLTGQIGYFSSVFNQLFEWESRFWSYGAQIAQIIFDAGGTQANVDAAVAAYMEKAAEYRDTALKSFREVEDGLADLRAAIDKGGHLALAVKDAGIAYKIAQERYLKGLTNYLDVVEAERTFLREEQSQAAALGDQYQATIALIQATGGTW